MPFVVIPAEPKSPSSCPEGEEVQAELISDALSLFTSRCCGSLPDACPLGRGAFKSAVGVDSGTVTPLVAIDVTAPAA